MNYLLLNFILKRSNSEPPNYRREQVTVLGKNRKKIKPGCKRNLNQGITIKFEPGLLLKKILKKQFRILAYNTPRHP